MLIDSGRRDLDIERRRETPVEIEQKYRVSRETEYGIPMLQAIALGIGAALTAGAFLWMLTAWEAQVFYIGVVISGTANLIWILRRADEFEDGVNLRDIMAAILVALFTGGLAFCLWGIVAYIAPNWALPSWLRKIQAVVSLLVFIGTGTTTLLLAPAFIQELLQRSPFQEQAIWGAVFTWLKRPEPPADAPPREVIHKAQMEIKRNEGKHIETVTFPVSPEKMQQVAQRWLAGGPFSGRNMAGRGRPLKGRQEYKKLRDYLIEKGLAEWVDEDAREQGVAITDDGKQVFEEYASGNGNRPTPPE